MLHLVATGEPYQIEINVDHESASPISHQVSWVVQQDGGLPLREHQLKYRPVSSQCYSQLIYMQISRLGGEHWKWVLQNARLKRLLRPPFHPPPTIIMDLLKFGAHFGDDCAAIIFNMGC